MMKLLPLFLFLGTMCWSANWAISLSAQTVYVRQGATGANDGSSWTNAFTDLQAAIDAAPADSELWIATGAYHPGEKSQSFRIDKQLHLYGGFSGSETALENRNPEDHPTMLSGDNLGNDPADDLSGNRTDNSYHVIELQSGSSGGSLNDLFITGGTGDANGVEEQRHGGGVFCLTASFVFNQCTFENNTAVQGGAIILAAAATGGIQFSDCIFQNNEAEYGGAISSFEPGSILRIEGSQFIGNRALHTLFDGGGAIYGGSLIELEIKQSDFVDNFSMVDGGAIALYNDPVATLTEVTFTSNHAENSDGGALYVNGRADLTITKSDFSQNQSADDGGALYLDLSEPYQLNFSENNFHNNSAMGVGGALFLSGLFIPNAMQISDSEFTENTSDVSGGAIYLLGAPLTVIDCQFQKNTAQLGGAISTDLNSVILDLKNCDFIENEAILGGAVELYRGGDSNTTNCRFLRNKAMGGSGGAIAYDRDKFSNLPPPAHTIDACIFDGNEASTLNGSGGFGSALLSFNANINITNSLFINQNAEMGATILNLAFNDQVDEIRLINCTFAQNENSGTATLVADNSNTSDQASYSLQNNIFADNGMGFTDITGAASVTSQGGNICSSDSMNDILTHERDQPTTDPKFKEDENDFSPANDSPAINAGVNTGAPEKDLVGFPRDGLVDIGAYESQEVSGLFDRPALVGQLAVYPNPVSDQLRMQLDNKLHTSLRVRIVDATGKMLWQQTLEKETDRLEKIISTSALPSGIYLLQLFSRAGERSIKFVKK